MIQRVKAIAQVWPSVLRVVVGVYWLYFGSQKWHGIDWMQGLMKGTADANPIPGLHELLTAVVVPNWFIFSLLQSVGENVVAVLLILGLATRWAGLLGTLLALNLALTVAFAVGDDGFRWLYYLALLANIQVFFSGPGPWALDRFHWVPARLRWSP